MSEKLPEFPRSFPLEQPEKREMKTLPRSLDNPNVLFAYGSLLIEETLRKTLNARKPGFPILETSDIEEADKLIAADPEAIVILRNVKLSGVRVSIVSQEQLREWYEQVGGKWSDLVEAGIDQEQIQDHAILFARPAKTGEKPRFLNGGLVCGLTTEELALLDLYEILPVYQRTKVPELEIQNEPYRPKHVAFYSANPDLEVSPKEQGRVRALLRQERKPNRLSPTAQWPETVRRKAKLKQ